MRKFHLLSLLLSALLLHGCAGKKISFDYDSSTDFSQIKTYQWDPQPSAGFAKANPLIHKRIISAIDKNLESRGLKPSDSADMTISYRLSLEKKLSSSPVSMGIGMSVGKSNRGHISVSSGNRLKEVTEGTLVIDMISNPDKTLIWRAMSSQKISRKASSAEKSESRINSIVYDMLVNYPPKKK